MISARPSTTRVKATSLPSGDRLGPVIRLRSRRSTRRLTGTVSDPAGVSYLRVALRGVRVFSWLLPNKQLAKLHHRLMMAGNPGALYFDVKNDSEKNRVSLPASGTSWSVILITKISCPSFVSSFS